MIKIVHPREWKRCQFEAMDNFFEVNIDFKLPIHKAIAQVKEAMLKRFSFKNVKWYFNLFEPFPEWTPSAGWIALASKIVSVK